MTETAAKYGKYCFAIAYGVLGNENDAEESVNDTYLDAWNAMPPSRPLVLATSLGKITRRISIDRWRRRNAGNVVAVRWKPYWMN
ncbi:MAG: RNA polymerase sigma factor [Oscillospiraceae bacterium]